MNEAHIESHKDYGITDHMHIKHWWLKWKSGQFIGKCAITFSESFQGYLVMACMDALNVYGDFLT